ISKSSIRGLSLKKNIPSLLGSFTSTVGTNENEIPGSLLEVATKSALPIYEALILLVVTLGDDFLVDDCAPVLDALRLRDSKSIVFTELEYLISELEMIFLIKKSSPIAENIPLRAFIVL